MDELIIRVLDGTASEDDVKRVALWRGQSPENQQRYEAVQLVWNETEPEPLSGDVDLSVVSRIVSAAAERENAAAHTRIPRRTSSARVLRWALPIAAGIAGVSLGILRWSHGSARANLFVAPATAGETFVLDDGSFVRLAAGARLRQEGASSGERYFELDGHALFAVTHDETRPFSVVAEGVEMRVLGTRFDVRALPEGGQRIAVLEGRVEVTNAYGRAELQAGEVSVASPGLPPTHTRPDDFLSLLDWPEGALLFQNTPLTQVAREVGWHFGTRVVVEGAELGAIRISAWYGSEPFSEVIESLCAASGASCTVSDSVAILSR